MGGRFRGPFPSREFVQVIAERAIGGEGFSRRTAPWRHSSGEPGMNIPADRPAHLAVPAASELQDGHPSQAAGDDSGPPPAGFLEFFWFFLLDSVGHRISGNRFLLLDQDRTNWGREQNLKGRRLGIPTPRVSAGHPKSPKRTCTNGHCGTHPKTITLGIGSSGLSLTEVRQLSVRRRGLAG